MKWSEGKSDRYQNCILQPPGSLWVLALFKQRGLSRGALQICCLRTCQSRAVFSAVVWDLVFGLQEVAYVKSSLKSAQTSAQSEQHYNHWLIIDRKRSVYHHWCVGASAKIPIIRSSADKHSGLCFCNIGFGVLPHKKLLLHTRVRTFVRLPTALCCLSHLAQQLHLFTVPSPELEEGTVDILSSEKI